LLHRLLLYLMSEGIVANDQSCSQDISIRSSIRVGQSGMI